ncbi:hypothetical protein [Mycoplasma procyoni]|uniref:hypothetical protein n=1 Tax=Mycoplasma procyoni TaxID=568784 RepID=UPI00197B0AFB|nr:hypothetical protein [Mycoplasma procyoni]MBN3535109.1 hypothetical protein [Mycoplasma procyoni]
MQSNKIAFWIDNKYSFVRTITLLIFVVISVVVSSVLLIVFAIYGFNSFEILFSDIWLFFIWFAIPITLFPLYIWSIINLSIILAIKSKIRKKQSIFSFYSALIRFYLIINFYWEKLKTDYDYIEENYYLYKKKKTQIFNYKKEVNKHIFLLSLIKNHLSFFLKIDLSIVFMVFSLLHFGIIATKEPGYTNYWMGIVHAFISLFFFVGSLSKICLIFLHIFNNRFPSLTYSSFVLSTLNFLSFRFYDAKRTFKFFKNRIRINKIDKSLDLEKVVFLGQKGLEKYTSTFYTINTIKILNIAENYDLVSVLNSFCTQTQNQSEFIYKGINIKLITNPFKNKEFIEELKTFENSAFYLLMLDFCNDVIEKIEKNKEYNDDIEMLDVLLDEVKIEQQQLKKSLDNLIDVKNTNNVIKFDFAKYYNWNKMQQIFDFIQGN